MSVVAFDTYAFVKRLTSAGMPETQAEVLADEQMRMIDDRLVTKADLRELAVATKADLRELAAATKADLKETESRLDAKIAEVKADFRTEIAPVKADALLLKWIMGFVLAFQVGIFAKLFMH